MQSITFNERLENGNAHSEGLLVHTIRNILHKE